MSMLRVLVIDDCDIARADMSDRLSSSGYKVSTLASPIGATRVIVEDKIDVVVIDVQMPSIRGDRLASLFRGNPRFSGLGVILVTGGKKEELERLAKTAEADFVLSKAHLDELPSQVRKAAGAQTRASNAAQG